MNQLDVFRDLPDSTLRHLAEIENLRTIWQDVTERISIQVAAKIDADFVADYLHQKEPTVDSIDIGIRPLSDDEWVQVHKALDRAGLGATINTHNLGIGFSRRGRFTMCMLRADLAFDTSDPFGAYPPRFFWGACRLDTRDEEKQDLACKRVLVKACRNLVEWLKEKQKGIKIQLEGPMHSGTWVDEKERAPTQTVPAIVFRDHDEPPFEGPAHSLTYIDANGETRVTQRREEKERIFLD